MKVAMISRSLLMNASASPVPVRRAPSRPMNDAMILDLSMIV